MAKITRKQVDDINARLLNGWKFDTRHFMLNGEKSVTMEIPLDEKHELSASISFYDSYECFEKVGTVAKIRVSKWENIGNGLIRSVDWGKSRTIAYTKPRKMFKDIEVLTAFITKEDIMEIYNGTEETAEITNIRMNSKGLWERVKENSEPMPEAVAEPTPDTNAGKLKPTKKRISALQKIVKNNKPNNQVAIQTENAQFFGNGFMFVMFVASCFIVPLSEFFSNIADGIHCMAGTFQRVLGMVDSTLKDKLQLPTMAELKEIKRVCKLDNGKSIVDFGDKLPCVNADYLQQVLESLSGKVEAWQANKNNVYLKDEYGNTAYIMGIQKNNHEFWKNTLERNRELEEELRKQESENFVKQVITDVERIAEAEEAAEKQENSVEESKPIAENPTAEQAETKNQKGENIMNDNITIAKHNKEQHTVENNTAWTGKADYAERRAEKAERYAERAEKARATADRLQKPINDMHGDIAFFTQPNINTSAGRAFTNQRNKMFANYEKGFGECDKAAYYDEKSENLSKEPTAISSDDPEALRKLKDKLEKLTAEHKEHLAHNKALKKAIKDGTSETNKFGWATLNGKSYYFTTNEAAEIRRLKDRIEELENLEVPENYSFDGGEIVFNAVENRVQILFDEKPDEETRGNLKRNGFKWSPRQGAWQRMLNTTGIRTVKRLYPTPELTQPEENSAEKISETEIDITAFVRKFNENYEFLYKHNDNVAGYSEALECGNTIIASDTEKSQALFKAYFETVHDCISSDREVVALAFTLDDMGIIDEYLPTMENQTAETAIKEPQAETMETAEQPTTEETSNETTENIVYPFILIDTPTMQSKVAEEKTVEEQPTENPTVAQPVITFDETLLSKARQMYYKVYVDSISDDGINYIGSETEISGIRARIIPSDSWDDSITFYSAKKFAEYMNEELRLESEFWSDEATQNQTAEPPIETITVEDTEIAVEKIPEVILEYKGNSEKLAILKDKALSLGATVSSTENHLTIDTYENHRPEIESVATELGLKTEEEMHETFSTVQKKINEVGTIEQKNIIYKIPWGVYRRYSAEKIINTVLVNTKEILTINGSKTENPLKAISGLIDSAESESMTADKAMKLITGSMEKAGATAEQIAQAEIAVQYIGNPNFRHKLNDYVFTKTYKAEENTSTESTASNNETAAQRKIRPPPHLTAWQFPKATRGRL